MSQTGTMFSIFSIFGGGDLVWDLESRFRLSPPYEFLLNVYICVLIIVFKIICIICIQDK